MTNDAWMPFREPVDSGRYESSAECGGGRDPHFSSGGVG
jgi:hypothetical protein